MSSHGHISAHMEIVCFREVIPSDRLNSCRRNQLMRIKCKRGWRRGKNFRLCQPFVLPEVSFISMLHASRIVLSANLSLVLSLVWPRTMDLPQDARQLLPEMWPKASWSERERPRMMVFCSLEHGNCTNRMSK